MTDERGVSIAVTHVMTIGITTILVSGLLIGASSMLDTQKERAGQEELGAIGDRHAAEMVTAVDRGYSTGSSVEIRSKQPDHATGGSYAVHLTNESQCFVRDGYDGCLELRVSGQNFAVEVPVSLPHGASVANETVQGGNVVVVYDSGTNEVTIRGDDG